MGLSATQIENDFIARMLTHLHLNESVKNIEGKRDQINYFRKLNIYPDTYDILSSHDYSFAGESDVVLIIMKQRKLLNFNSFDFTVQQKHVKWVARLFHAS